MTNTTRPYINNEDKGSISLKYQENNHHIFAKEGGGTNTKDNIVRLFEPVHKSYHRIFGTEQIREAILQMLKINSNAITAEFRKDIEKVLKEDDLEYYYKD